jgi:hypothetical protein
VAVLTRAGRWAAAALATAFIKEQLDVLGLTAVITVGVVQVLSWDVDACHSWPFLMVYQTWQNSPNNLSALRYRRRRHPRSI